MKTKGLKDFDFYLNDQRLFLVQTSNNRFTNTKIPIFNFSNEEFQQIAKGKKLVEGLIAIKQTDIKILTKKIYLTNNFSKEYMEYKNEILDLKQYKTTGTELNKIDEYIEKLDEIQKAENKYNDNDNIVDLLDNLDGFTIEMKEVDNSAYKITLTDVHFTEINSNLDISEPSGIIIYKYFAKWKKTGRSPSTNTEVF